MKPRKTYEVKNLFKKQKTGVTNTSQTPEAGTKKITAKVLEKYDQKMEEKKK